MLKDSSNRLIQVRPSAFWASVEVHHQHAPLRRFRYRISGERRQVERVSVVMHQVQGWWWVHEQRTGILLSEDPYRERALRQAELLLFRDGLADDCEQAPPVIILPYLEAQVAIAHQLQELGHAG